MRSLVWPEPVRYPAQDGLELSGWLYRPPANRARAVGAQLPRRPRSPGAPGFERPTRRCSRGICVFAPNVRGSAGFGKKFVNLDNGEKRFDGVKRHQGHRRLPGRRRASPTRSGSASRAARTAAT